MKLVTIIATLLSISAYAGDTITCTNAKEPELLYVLTSSDYVKYDFKVTKKVLVVNSCQSRTGCVYKNEVVYKDKLKMTDLQGAGVFKSKRTYIQIEDMDYVDYGYTVKDENGKIVQKSATLSCK